MYKTIIFALLFFICLTSCHRKPTEFEYDYRKLIVAWKDNDSLYLKDWVSHLEKLDLPSFANRISEYANETNFPYGNIDVEGDIKERWKEEEEGIMRRNVVRVYCEYNRSCLFLNKLIPPDRTDSICVKYWREHVLSEQEIDSLRIDMENICNKNTPGQLLE